MDGIGSPARPRRSVRWRFTVLYSAVFLVSAIGLLVLTNLLARVRVTRPAPGQEPYARPPTLAEAQEQLGLLATELAELHAAQSRQLLTGSLIALFVMAVVAILLGGVVAGRVLRPLRTIAAATRRITADNLHERLAVPGPADEVKDLADTIDGLLERLEASFTAQRRFVANASHELRTPLATMRAALDVAAAKPGPIPPQTRALTDRLRPELDRIDRLLEGLLALARAQHGALHHGEPVPLADVAADALAGRAAGIAARDLTVDADLRDPAPTAGGPALLSRMADNLIDNAVVHNRPGGWIRVTTTSGSEGARLVVESGGAVLEPEQVARLGRPFHRLGAARTGSGTGSGLGLSIVAAVVDGHGGLLDLHARPEGGLRVTVTLPLAPAQPVDPAQPLVPAAEPGRVR